jgi:hypothetical protein
MSVSSRRTEPKNPIVYSTQIGLNGCFPLQYICAFGLLQVWTAPSGGPAFCHLMPVVVTKLRGFPVVGKWCSPARSAPAGGGEVTCTGGVGDGLSPWSTHFGNESAASPPPTPVTSDSDSLESGHSGWACRRGRSRPKRLGRSRDGRDNSGVGGPNRTWGRTAHTRAGGTRTLGRAAHTQAGGTHRPVWAAHTQAGGTRTPGPVVHRRQGCRA